MSVLRSLAQHRLERGQQRVRENLRTFRRGMNAVLLDCAGDGHEVFVNHGNKRRVVFFREVRIDLRELMNIVRSVVWRQSNAGEQHFDVRRFQTSEYRIEIVTCLHERKSAKPVVAAEFDNHDQRMKPEDRRQAGYGVFSRRAAGAFILDRVVVAQFTEIALQRIRVRLAPVKAITRRDAVAEADQQRIFGCQERESEEQQSK